AVTAGGGGSARGRGRDRGLGGHAELLLERLDALGELENGARLQLVDPLLGAGGHVVRSSCGLSGLAVRSSLARTFGRRLICVVALRLFWLGRLRRACGFGVLVLAAGLRGRFGCRLGGGLLRGGLLRRALADQALL